MPFGDGGFQRKRLWVLARTRQTRGVPFRCLRAISLARLGKTRIGFDDDSEYETLLDLYCRCGISELIVHPRIQKDLYRGVPRRKLYGETLERAPFPVAYNGDIFDVADFNELVATYPKTSHVMIGRGILTNPALARMIDGGEKASREELQRFHDNLYQAYTDVMGGNAVFRMKEWWFYVKHSFTDPTSITRAIRKIRRADDYETVARYIFTTEEMSDSPRFY